MVPHPPLIVGEVGRGAEKTVQATIDAYRTVAKEIARLQPETIIISSPHSVMYADYFHISPGSKAEGSFARFNAPEVSFSERYDEELVAAICRETLTSAVHAGTKGERDASLDHGTMVPLYFVRQCYTNYKLVRIGLSGEPYSEHYRLGQCIQRAIEKTGRNTVFIASGDLSHKLSADGPYGFAAEGPEYDEKIMDVMGHAAFGRLFDFDSAFCENAAECGHRSFLIMAGVLDGTAVKTDCLSHEGTTGVGYGICMYHPLGRDAERNFLAQKLADIRNGEDIYVQLARRTVELYTHKAMTPRTENGRAHFPAADGENAELSLPEDMLSRRAGTFVSLHKDGQLRGCIGTISATENSIAEEIVRNAVCACSQDPRFAPVTAAELQFLVYSVDVLGPIEEISSAAELDVKRYGVICSKGRKRGLLLPNLEGVTNVEQQIEIACRKGGITKAEKPSLSRFEVVRHH